MEPAAKARNSCSVYTRLLPLALVGGPLGWRRRAAVVAVNYSPNQSQGHVRLPMADLAGKPWRLRDQASGAHYDWNGDDLVGRGLYLDMTPWQAAVLEPRAS